jgi:ribosomal protein L37AE/L43A
MNRQLVRYALHRLFRRLIGDPQCPYCQRARQRGFVICKDCQRYVDRGDLPSPEQHVEEAVARFKAGVESWTSGHECPLCDPRILKRLLDERGQT